MPTNCLLTAWCIAMATTNSKLPNTPQGFSSVLPPLNYGPSGPRQLRAVLSSLASWLSTLPKCCVGHLQWASLSLLHLGAGD